MKFNDEKSRTIVVFKRDKKAKKPEKRLDKNKRMINFNLKIKSKNITLE